MAYWVYIIQSQSTGRYYCGYSEKVAIDFPELRIVCGHIGYPWTTEMIAVATKHPNVFIELGKIRVVLKF